MINYKKIIDISLPIYPGMIRYPGNPSVEFKTVRGKSSTLTEFSLGTHTGTHVDAQSHVFETGRSVDKIKLETLIGSCRVLDFSRAQTSITVKELRSKRIQLGERILLKTSNSKRGFKKFYSDYIFVDGDASEYLAERGVTLVGIDALSIKQRGSNDHRPHTVLLKKNVVIVEGLNLRGVSAGRYLLIVMPLNLQGLDGAPARVVLMK